MKALLPFFSPEVSVSPSEQLLTYGETSIRQAESIIGREVKGGVFNQQRPRVTITSHPTDREKQQAITLPCSLEGSELRSQMLGTFCHCKKEKRKV